jgi:hypothetical protein
MDAIEMFNHPLKVKDNMFIAQFHIIYLVKLCYLNCLNNVQTILV